jgi:hypothetical protein
MTVRWLLRVAASCRHGMNADVLGCGRPLLRRRQAPGRWFRDSGRISLGRRRRRVPRSQVEVLRYKDQAQDLRQDRRRGLNIREAGGVRRRCGRTSPRDVLLLIFMAMFLRLRVQGKCSPAPRRSRSCPLTSPVSPWSSPKDRGCCTVKWRRAPQACLPSSSPSPRGRCRPGPCPAHPRTPHGR